MKILFFDGYSIINRAFYAIPLLTSSKGEYTNAVYGFISIFLRFLDEEKPDYITVAFDLPVPTFRHNIYGAYKGTRRSMPDELKAQVPLVKVLLTKMGVRIAEHPGFEADDVIGTLANKAAAEGMQVVIVSGDRDLLQLATDEVKVRIPKTKGGKTEVEDYFAADVEEKYGVTPKAYIDVKALMGDASDNIPGVPGIGEVTATKIIKAYGSLEAALENVGEIKPKKAAGNLQEYWEQALLSRKLATIVLDAPVELELGDASQIFNEDSLGEVKRLEIRSLYKRFEGEKKVANKPVTEFEVVNSADRAGEVFGLLENKPTALYTLWDDEVLVGMGLSSDAVGALYISGISLEELLWNAVPWLESDAPKFVFDIKLETIRWRRLGVELGGVSFDAHLAAYVLNALNTCDSPADIARDYLDETVSNIEDVLGNKGKRGKDRRGFKDLSFEEAAGLAAVYADAINRARPKMEDMLDKNQQTSLFAQIEMPLALLLAEMEGTGIKVDKNALIAFGNVLDERILSLTSEILELAGEDFNLNSPAQMGKILFEKLQLKGGKKTTKGFSTAADELEKLADKHPIVPLILEYRAHSKLKSTYVDGLLPLICPVSSRVHSTFHQALTATGRLSSAEPNLQNIPVRMSLGRELRKAFVPEDGMVFIDADYSQIELRLLAHMSGDPVFIDAFCNDLDIHRLTAAQVLGISPEDVTAEQRGNAKAVNFGIIYGISAFGLSEDLKIQVKEAEGYINGYFDKYPGVKAYLDATINNAREEGYVLTMYNRRRQLPELKSSNYNTRQFGERVAMNMPIQGSAADIIKIAMLNVNARLRREGLVTKLVLQVHDELLLEAPADEAEAVKRILKEEMEQAASLKVPLTADVKTGKSWYETK